jgi:hypothetical protein
VKELTKADLLELVSVTSQAPSPLPLLMLRETGAWLGGARPATPRRQNPERTEGGVVLGRRRLQ